MAARDHPVGSWYVATADRFQAFPPLDGDTRADVAIVGGGLTGLSAALHLAQAGLDVVLVEANRVGWGASGRNGGQLHTGLRRDPGWLAARIGRDDADRVWTLAAETANFVHGLIARHRIDCDWRPGHIHALHKARFLDGARGRIAARNAEARFTWYDRDQLAAALGTDIYHGGWHDSAAGHLHPLKFAFGLARAASAVGARIHEGTVALRLCDGARPAIETACGVVSADHVILSGNGYLEGLDRAAEARVMPIKNYVLVTEPIGAGAPGGVLQGGEAASDSRFVVHYWRPTPDGRLLFGGGETYSRRDPADIGRFVRRHLLSVYPRLDTVRIDHAWGGTLAVTVNRLPFIRQLRAGVYIAAGYSGMGLALAPYAGKVLADAVAGSPEKLDAFAKLPCPPFPGGRWMRAPVLAAAMTWFALRDRL